MPNSARHEVLISSSYPDSEIANSDCQKTSQLGTLFAAYIVTMIERRMFDRLAAEMRAHN